MAVADNANQMPTDRDIRAAEEAMVVVPIAPGMYEVYSGTQAKYLVDVVEGACECDDMYWNDPEDGCKHVRRVRQTLGLDPIPEGVRRVDPTLPKQRRQSR